MIGGGYLQPDISFRIINPQIPGISVQPTTGKDYPAIVFEMANTERFTDLLHKCHVWLSDKTNVNVWVGVKYERRANRAADQWWMGVSHRNFAAMAAGRPAHLAANALWPDPVWLHAMNHGGQILTLPLLNGPMDLCSTPQPGQWQVPLNIICHPTVLPPPPPPAAPFPPLTIIVDLYRDMIVNERLP